MGSQKNKLTSILKYIFSLDNFGWGILLMYVLTTVSGTFLASGAIIFFISYKDIYYLVLLIIGFSMAIIPYFSARHYNI